MRTRIARVTPSSSAVMLVLIFIVTAVLLWHVAAFEAPAIAPRPVHADMLQRGTTSPRSVEKAEDAIIVTNITTSPNSTTAMSSALEPAGGGGDGDL